jgi:hypothetical protein
MASGRHRKNTKSVRIPNSLKQRDRLSERTTSHPCRFLLEHVDGAGAPKGKMEHNHGPHRHHSRCNCHPHSPSGRAEQGEIDHVAGPDWKHPRSATDRTRRREGRCTGPDADPARWGEGCCARSGSEEDEVNSRRSQTKGRVCETRPWLYRTIRATAARTRAASASPQ